MLRTDGAPEGLGGLDEFDCHRQGSRPGACSAPMILVCSRPVAKGVSLPIAKLVDEAGGFVLRPFEEWVDALGVGGDDLAAVVQGHEAAGPAVEVGMAVLVDLLGQRGDG